MNIISNIIPNFSDIFQIAFLVIFKYYGWVLFVFGLINILWRVYYLEIEHQYIHNQEWTFLQIKVPRENMVSTLAVESIFSQMHSLHVGKTFLEKYVEGQIQLWYSLEIISLGGKISFTLRIPTRMRDVVESAFYAHYPQAEIGEVSDYMEKFHFDAYKNDNQYEIFGAEWKLSESEVVPIKTYADFEHQTAEQKIIDPLANFFEGMAKIQPYEFIAFQINIQPVSDEEWQPKVQSKVKMLIGEEVPHKASFTGFLLSPFDAFAKFNYSETLFGHHAHAEEGNKPKNNWISMTEAEKDRVKLVEKKASKPGYKTKIRMLYIAPKDKFDNGRKSLMSGIYRPLGSVATNKLKPDVSRTWTGADAHFSKELEAGIMERKIKRRKKYFFKAYKERNVHIGLPGFILNVEEIATLYHFPITTETTLAPSAVEKTESKKSQPPVNLPVVE